MSDDQAFSARIANSVPHTRSPRSRRLLAVGAASALVGAGVVAVSAPAFASTQTVTFDSPGAQSWTVPAGVTSIVVDAIGGSGGSLNQSGGAGGLVHNATLAVSPGDTVYVHVASNGGYQSAGANGGGASAAAAGGGGASDVRLGADTLADRVLVAAGGGGAGSPSYGTGGDAGFPGQDGLGPDTSGYCNSGNGGPHSAAQPGLVDSGGAGGTGCGAYAGNPGGDGTFGVGGDGANSPYGGAGGGGGGGYYGGGGGAPYGGGAGGADYVSPSVSGASVGTAVYGTTPSVTISFDDGKSPQTISYTSSPPTGASVGGTYLVTATSKSGDPVAFSTSSNACTVSDTNNGSATVSFAHAGDCAIDANQAGNKSYDPAPQAVQTVTVAPADQAVEFTSTPPSNPVVGGSYTVSATGNPASGNAISFLPDPSSDACALTDNGDGTATVYLNRAGTCTVQAYQDASADYNQGYATQAVTVARAPQAITFPALKTMRLHRANQPLHATAAGPITYSVRTPRICSIQRASVHAIRVGTCTVVAHQAGTSDYLPAPAKARSFKVTR